MSPETGVTTPHPGEPHEFRTTCLRCGEAGYLHVLIITDDQIVKVEDRPALRSTPASETEG